MIYDNRLNFTASTQNNANLTYTFYDNLNIGVPRENIHIKAEFRGANFFTVEIFPKQNRDSDPVKNSESHDMKILILFPGNPTLEIWIKICICVGSTHMRGRFFL